MRKIIKFPIIIIICFVVFGYVGFFNVFAECRTCNKSPKNLELYLDVMKELINVLPMSGAKKNILGNGNSNSKEMLENARKNAKKMQEKILVPYIPDYTKIYADFKVLYKTKAYKRDFEKLVKVQEMIADRVSSMVLENQQNKKISIEDLQKIDKLLKKLGYLSLKKTKNGIYFLSLKAIEYKDIAKFIWNLGQMYTVLHKEKFRYRKELKEVGTGYLKVKHSDIDIASEVVEDENLKIMASNSKELYMSFYKTKENEVTEKIDFMRHIEFDEESFRAHIRQIHDDYACAVGLATNTCSNRQIVRKEMSYLQKKTIKDSRASRNTFIVSWKRLMGSFGIGNSADKIAAKQREESLLHSYRGTDTPTKDNRRDIVNVGKNIDPTPMSSSAIWKNVRTGWKKMSDSVSSVKKKNKERRSAKTLQKGVQGSKEYNQEKYLTFEMKKRALEEKKIKEKIENTEKWKIKYLKNYKNEGVLEEKIENFQNIFHDVLLMQDEIQVENVFVDVRRVTQKFPALSASVYRGYDILGDKGTTKKLYNSMGNVCKEQCTNLNGKKCWAKEGG